MKCDAESRLIEEVSLRQRALRRLNVCLALAGTAVALLVAGASGAPLDPCPPRDIAPGWCGDGGVATAAHLAFPKGVAGTRDGGFLIADTGNNVVRRVSPRGVITRIAGIGLPGHSGDGGPARGARLRMPTCVAEDADGSVLVRDINGLRRIGRGGIITSVSCPDACRPAMLPNGDRLVVDQAGSVIRRVSPNGQARIVAGTGNCRYSGEGVPATRADLALPSGVAVLPDGGFLIADTENHLVRRVTPGGIIRTVAGSDPWPTGQCGASGEYGPPIYFVIRGPVRGREHRPLVRGSAYQPVTVRYETTYNVSVVFIVKRRTTALARIRRRAESGIAVTKLGVSLSSGTYLLKLRGSGMAIAAGGQKVAFRRTRLATLVISP